MTLRRETLRGTSPLPAAAAMLVVVPLLLGGCSSAASPGGGRGSATTAQLPPCTFTNPVARGADPWVVRRGDAYYYVQSEDRGIKVYRSATLTGIRDNPVTVWTSPAQGWNHSNVWAPELHFVDGKWYIYYAAGRLRGGPFIHQRAGVLESVTADPQGAYVDRGMLYTGNDLAAGGSPIWAIDLTVARINGQLYAVWSGWTDNTPAPGPQPDRKPQQTYIARMSNPWTISSDRVMISAPTESWERGTELDLQEGPEFVQRAGETFILYSTRESWLPEYKLGQLRLTPATADPLVAANWVKSGPVFTGAGKVYGVGHASFTVSPDSSEHWIVYHSKSVSAPGWNDRVIRMQTFGWHADGSPNFGTPLPSGTPVAVPAGQCAG